MDWTNRCMAAIEGPRVSRRLVAWRRHCRRIVKGGGPCWQHRPFETRMREDAERRARKAAR